MPNGTFGMSLTGLTEELRQSLKVVEQLKADVAAAKAAALVGDATVLPGGARVLVAVLDGVDGKALQVGAKGRVGGSVEELVCGRARASARACFGGMLGTVTGNLEKSRPSCVSTAQHPHARRGRGRRAAGVHVHVHVQRACGNTAASVVDAGCLAPQASCLIGTEPFLERVAGSRVTGSVCLPTAVPPLQEAAVGLQEKLGDPSAVVLLSSPEPDKVALVAALSAAAVKAGIKAGQVSGHHCPSFGLSVHPSVCRSVGRSDGPSICLVLVRCWCWYRWSASSW
jgi:hypothetical protein